MSYTIPENDVIHCEPEALHSFHVYIFEWIDHVTNSPDGKTYLAIADDQNGCPIKVDGQTWTAPKGTPQPISPGKHAVECYGGTIEFVIPKGVVFNFDYWGP